MGLIINESSDNTKVDSSSSSYNNIINNQLMKVISLSSTEHRGGYYSIIHGKGGTEREVYIPDTRESLSNAIYALATLLKKDFDETMKQHYRKFLINLKTIKTVFMEKSSVDETSILGEAFYESQEDKILLEDYKNKKLRLHKNLFSQLCSQIKELQSQDMGSDIF